MQYPGGVESYRGRRAVDESTQCVYVASLKTSMESGNVGLTGSVVAYNESGLSRSLREAMANAQLGTLFITGHSLGGALAVLAALDLAGKTAAGVPLVSGNIHVNTFGAPRVGNQTFAAHVEKVRRDKIPTLMQYRSEDDVVPTSPLPCGVASTLLYEHVGDFTYFRTPRLSLAASQSIISNYLPYARSAKLSSIGTQ